MINDFDNYQFPDGEDAGRWVDDSRMVTPGGEELFTVKFYPTAGEAPILRPRLTRT